ncbi:hypothetical protein PGT21_032621 [Puccinia graminis f. sp. tritici]|uniref:NADH dehydrogenase [ubiquinone] 1 alpha subcomplex subunit 13 n=1 Tax=Puccinia graminis f. sp. tritici TaxID=56615 RepID=A0A5B0LKS0_PUCGR|nr:hypothetical protein PGTUg99_002032 [Puccinia graminis f. sp. tritici]KAA1094913.1 hypothetical protein PGT21_032621 [Puccinia graminis f. sp. tritici]
MARGCGARSRPEPREAGTGARRETAPFAGAKLPPPTRNSQSILRDQPKRKQFHPRLRLGNNKHSVCPASSRMSIPYKQELPPVGGYEPVKFKRNLPIRGPSGSLIIGGVFVTCLYGFYRYGQGNVEKRELKRENIWSRIHLVPILTAENDRDLFRRERARIDREREIMKDDPTWVVGQSVYNTKKYVPTTIVPL